MNERYALALGEAVIQSWGDLPQAVQHDLFEKAIIAGHKTERDESLREQLAAFLHDQHPRTINADLRQEKRKARGGT